MDARFIATVDAIGRDLKHGNSLYRYVAPDDFGEPETSFTICTFWYIDALAAIGRMDEAREMFELLLKQRNHLACCRRIWPSTAARPGAISRRPIRTSA